MAHALTRHHMYPSPTSAQHTGKRRSGVPQEPSCGGQNPLLGHPSRARAPPVERRDVCSVQLGDLVSLVSPYQSHDDKQQQVLYMNEMAMAVARVAPGPHHHRPQIETTGYGKKGGGRQKRPVHKTVAPLCASSVLCPIPLRALGPVYSLCYVLEAFLLSSLFVPLGPSPGAGQSMYVPGRGALREQLGV